MGHGFPSKPFPIFHLVSALVHTATLTQETREQEGEWQDLGAILTQKSKMLASH